MNFGLLSQFASPTLGLDQASKLGRDFKTFGFNSGWTGSEDDSFSAGIAGRVMNDADLMAKLGLTNSDIQFKAGGYQADAYNPGQYTISDKARQALSGLTMSRTGFEGKSDGRSQVLRDAQGNVLSIGAPYSYDPAGDLKDAALKAAAVMAAAYGAGQYLGVDGAAAGAGGAGGAGGAAGSSMTANPAWLEQALAGDFAASQAAAMNSLGAGAGLTAGELAAIGGAGLGAAGGAAGAAAGASGATSAAGGLTGLLKDAAPYLKTALPIAGAVAGSKPSGGGSQTTQSKTDPRLDPYLYGDQGILSQAQKWFQANQQPNQAMQQGWQMQMGLLGDPAIQQQMGQLRSSAMGLLGGPIAGNGFARFYGG